MTTLNELKSEIEEIKKNMIVETNKAWETSKTFFKNLWEKYLYNKHL